MRNESAPISSASPYLGGGYSQEDIDSILTKGSGFQDSKFKKWWDVASKPKKILAILGGLLAGGFALYLLVAFLREFGYLLFGIAVIGGFILTITTGSEKEKIETRKTIVKTVIGLGIAIVIAFVVVLKPDFTANIFQPGANVRNAYLTQYSETVTVENVYPVKCTYTSSDANKYEPVFEAMIDSYAIGATDDNASTNSEMQKAYAEKVRELASENDNLRFALDGVVNKRGAK